MAKLLFYALSVHINSKNPMCHQLKSLVMNTLKQSIINHMQAEEKPLGKVSKSFMQKKCLLCYSQLKINALLLNIGK